MKYLIFCIAIIGSLIAGFFLGRFSMKAAENNAFKTERTIIRDTIIKEKTIKIFQPVMKEENLSKSDITFINQENDSLNIENDVDTTSFDIPISREILLKSENIEISYLNEEPAQTDSLLRDNLGIKTNKNKFITIEYWESPLNFEGYKLSKGKLIVYGIATQFDFEFIKNGNLNYLTSNEISYNMKESDDFNPLIEVNKSEVYGD